MHQRQRPPPPPPPHLHLRISILLAAIASWYYLTDNTSFNNFLETKTTTTSAYRAPSLPTAINPPLPNLSPLGLALHTNCSTTHQAHGQRYLILDSNGTVLQDSQEEQVLVDGSHGHRYHHIFILSLDEEGRLLCDGGPYYVVFVRGEYVSVRPRVTDLRNGLHLVQVLIADLVPPSLLQWKGQDDSDSSYPVEVTVQLRWGNTDFATNDHVVYDYQVQKSHSEPVRRVVWRVVVDDDDEVMMDRAGSLPERVCGPEDMREYDEEEEQYRYNGRWVRLPSSGLTYDNYGDYPPPLMVQSDGW